MVTVVHLITGLETGGAERMLSRLVARTDRDRFRSLVVSITGPGNMAPAVDRAGIELISLGIRRGVPDPRGLFRLGRILREVQGRPRYVVKSFENFTFSGEVADRVSSTKSS